MQIGRERSAAILGAPRFESEMAMRTSVPGVATGLAWTPVGGDILFIEATRIPGSGRLILTGQLGDVMKESAQAALSIVKNAQCAWYRPSRFEKSDIHVHVPAGAIPKDGPSAGVAMFMALTSLMTGSDDPQRYGDDRRDQLARPCASGRWHQGKGAGGARSRDQASHAAGAQSAGLRGHPGNRAQGMEFIWLERVEEAVAAALSQRSRRRRRLPFRNSLTPRRKFQFSARPRESGDPAVSRPGSGFPLPRR